MQQMHQQRLQLWALLVRRLFVLVIATSDSVWVAAFRSIKDGPVAHTDSLVTRALLLARTARKQFHGELSRTEVHKTGARFAQDVFIDFYGGTSMNKFYRTVAACYGAHRY